MIGCMGLPNISYGDVYKCKEADGKISYSDQECPGTAAKRLTSRPTSTPSTSPVANQKYDDKMANAVSKSDVSKPNQYPRYSPDPPMSLQEKEKWRAQIKEIDRKIDAFEADQSQRCKTGDTKACVETACNSLNKREGPAADFIFCAKARGLPHGRYWVITSGTPEGDPQYDKHLLEAALTPRLPLGRHVTSTSTMKLMCFRKSGGRTDPLSDQYRIEQILYVAKGANGPLLTLMFAQDGYGAYGTRTMPEYKTLEELIDKTCER